MFKPENYFIFWTQEAFHGKHDFCFHRTLNKHFCVHFYVDSGTKGGHMLNVKNKVV